MNFVSCEDDMVKVYGIFNFACTSTSFIILALPIRYLRRCYSRSYQSGKSRIILEQKIYSVTLSALFVFNLYEHMTGYTGPPSIQAFGIVNNTVLSSILYRIWHSRNLKSKRDVLNLSMPSPVVVTTLFVILSIFFLCIGLVADMDWENHILQIVSIPINIYVIFTMGRLSWSYDRGNAQHDKYDIEKKGNQQQIKNTTSLSRLWRRACIFLVLVGVGTESESLLCDNLNSFTLGGVNISRLYHPIYLHLIITTLFYYVSECAFQLVEREFVNQVNEKNSAEKMK